MSALTTLEKIKRFEEYLTVEQTVSDQFLDQALIKLAYHERSRLLTLKARLERQAQEFEQRYALASAEFYPRYEKGAMGDLVDFMEWAATIEMLNRLTYRLTLLSQISPS